MEPSSPSTTRRALLGSAAIGSIALAGCISSGAAEDDPQASSTGTPTPPPTTTVVDPTATPDRDVDADELPPGHEWLDRINVVRGRIDSRPTETVDVAVGGGPVAYAFSPAVLTVAPGTDVVWKWTGLSGPANVVSIDGDFDSGQPVDRQGHTFRATFEEPGEYRYLSEPTAACGMGGVVRVEPLPDSAYPEVNGWLRDVDNFDGTVADRTTADVVDVAVGATGNGGNFAFAPPAVKITSGTTVRWEWTGNGGAHDVAFEDLDLDSGEVVAEAGYTLEYTFEQTGAFLYHCRPHSALGMRGAVVVD